MNFPVARVATCVVIALLSVVVVTEARAGETDCSKLLTVAELNEATGLEFRVESDPVSHRPGHSECTFWVGTGDAVSSVSLMFATLEAIRDWVTPFDSIPEFYDSFVSSEQDVTGQKGEKLSKTGVRAILFKESVPARVFIETKSGFIGLDASALTPEQLVAVAKAAVSQ